MTDKKPKKRKPRKKQAKPSITISEREQLLRDMEAECREQLSIVETRRKELTPGSFDPQLTSATNTLAKSIAILSAEGRQQDKHKHQAIAELTHEAEDGLIREFLAEVSPARRRAYAAFLGEFMDAESLLGHGE